METPKSSAFAVPELLIIARPSAAAAIAAYFMCRSCCLNGQHNDFAALRFRAAKRTASCRVDVRAVEAPLCQGAVQGPGRPLDLALSAWPDDVCSRALKKRPPFCAV